jgi:hypothetical protein
VCVTPVTPGGSQRPNERVEDETIEARPSH